MIKAKGVADSEAFLMLIIGIFIACTCYNMEDMKFKVCPAVYENKGRTNIHTT